MILCDRAAFLQRDYPKRMIRFTLLSGSYRHNYVINNYVIANSAKQYLGLGDCFAAIPMTDRTSIIMSLITMSLRLQSFCHCDYNHVINNNVIATIIIMSLRAKRSAVARYEANPKQSLGLSNC